MGLAPASNGIIAAIDYNKMPAFVLDRIGLLNRDNWGYIERDVEPGMDQPICMIDNIGQEYYYYYDGLGSVVALSNNGTVVERYRYDPFGKTIVCDGSGQPRSPNVSLYGNRFMFTGRDWDGNTGLYYYRFRDYSPALGRFLQTDPIGYADSMNLYQYCGNNPINWIDPWGLCSKQQEPIESWHLGRTPLGELWESFLKNPLRFREVFRFKDGDGSERILYEEN